MEDIQKHCNLLADRLKQQAISDKKPQMEAYMKNREPFFGVPSPQRKETLKMFLQEYGLPKNDQIFELVKTLFKMPERELHYCAVDILAKVVKKLSAEEALKVTKFAIETKSLWDTVDLLASNLLGQILKSHPHKIEEVNTLWMESGNMWLQRSCLLFQLKYKSATDTELLAQNIEYLMFEDDFFIRKAIGWVLREYAKTNPKWVLNFVHNHELLSNLSKREALKHLNKGD